MPGGVQLMEPANAYVVKEAIQRPERPTEGAGRGGGGAALTGGGPCAKADGTYIFGTYQFKCVWFHNKLRRRGLKVPQSVSLLTRHWLNLFLEAS